MSRARRVFMTGFWTVGGQGVAVLSQLIAVPFFLKAWSERTYTDWIALSALVSVLQYADGGMQLHVVNVLTQSATQERWEDFRRDLSSATLMYLFAAGAAILGTAALCGWLNLSGHFAGRALEHQAVGVAALLGVQIAMQLLSGFLTGLYRAFGRADRMQLVNFMIRAGGLAATIAILWIGRGVLLMAGIQLFIYAGAIIWLVLDLRRLDPHIVLTPRGAEASRAFEFLGPSLRYLFVSVSQGLTQQGTVIVIDAIAPMALVQFTTTRTVATSVRQLVALFTNSAWPELTRLDAQGDRKKLALANRLLAKLTCAVALPVIATLFYVGIPLYQVWTRGRAESNEHLLRLLLLDVLATVPWYATAFVLVATSRIKAISNLYLVAGIVHVVLCVVLVKTMGIDGVAVALLLVTIGLFNTLVPRWSMEAVGETFGSYLRYLCLPYVGIAAVTFAVAWVANAYAGPWVDLHSGLSSLAAWLSLHSTRLAPITMTLGRTVVVMLPATAVGGLLSWRLLFQSEERALLLRSIRAIIRRPTPALSA